MSFLQPLMLLALPVIALPIVIHLINQRRFQTVQWAAMQFLLKANKMSRGYARLRQWLILAARTLAIAGLVFAIARPLSSGLLGIAGSGQTDTTIVLLDRSPSMTQRGPNGESKLESGLQQLNESLSLLGSNRFVLIDSGTSEPQEFEEPSDLLKLANAQPVSASADITQMLEVTDAYLRANRPSRCEVWICSDIRQSDWKPESGRWEAVRNSLLDLPQAVRFHLLAYSETGNANLSLRVTSVRRVQRDRGAELLLSLRIEQQGLGMPQQGLGIPQQDRASPGENAELNRAPIRVPIQLEIDGARSEFDVEMVGGQIDLVDYSIPIEDSQKRGWGRVSIPTDIYPADNEYFFVYDEAMERKTLIVAEDPDSVVPLRLAASLPPAPDVQCVATVVTPDQAISANVESPALVIWQAAIPDEDDPKSRWLNQLQATLLFCPPVDISDATFAGAGWTSWQEGTAPISNWVADQGLLAATQSGAALPVGKWVVNRFVPIQGEVSALATVGDGVPLLARSMTDRDVFFLGTTVSPTDSSLASDGIALYALIQRAIALGAENQGMTQQQTAGELSSEDAQGWRRIAGNSNALSSQASLHAGVYRSGDQLIAVNRSESEDRSAIVPDDQLDSLFGQLSFDRVNDTAGNRTSLIQEIWRLFLVVMLLALIGEAWLCVPKATLGEGSATTARSSFFDDARRSESSA
ncbi:MAG: BatA domain-containing protein [Planctomycetota bacterium]